MSSKEKPTGQNAGVNDRSSVDSWLSWLIAYSFFEERLDCLKKHRWRGRWSQRPRWPKPTHLRANQNQKRTTIGSPTSAWSTASPGAFQCRLCPPAEKFQYQDKRTLVGHVESKLKVVHHQTNETPYLHISKQNGIRSEFLAFRREEELKANGFNCKNSSADTAWLNTSMKVFIGISFHGTWFVCYQSISYIGALVLVLRKCLLLSDGKPKVSLSIVREPVTYLPCAHKPWQPWRFAWCRIR